jgi:hypothetical protein
MAGLQFRVLIGACESFWQKWLNNLVHMTTTFRSIQRISRDFARARNFHSTTFCAEHYPRASLQVRLFQGLFLKITIMPSHVHTDV